MGRRCLAPGDSRTAIRKKWPLQPPPVMTTFCITPGSGSGLPLAPLLKAGGGKGAEPPHPTPPWPTVRAKNSSQGSLRAALSFHSETKSNKMAPCCAARPCRLLSSPSSTSSSFLPRKSLPTRLTTEINLLQPVEGWTKQDFRALERPGKSAHQMLRSNTYITILTY